VDGRHGYGDAFSLFFWRWVLLCCDCARGVGCQARAGGCRLPRVVIVDASLRSRGRRSPLISVTRVCSIVGRVLGTTNMLE
jgi:hypothetical protein